MRPIIFLLHDIFQIHDIQVSFPWLTPFLAILLLFFIGVILHSTTLYTDLPKSRIPRRKQSSTVNRFQRIDYMIGKEFGEN